MFFGRLSCELLRGEQPVKMWATKHRHGTKQSAAAAAVGEARQEQGQ